MKKQTTTITLTDMEKEDYPNFNEHGILEIVRNRNLFTKVITGFNQIGFSLFMLKTAGATSKANPNILLYVNN